MDHHLRGKRRKQVGPEGGLGRNAVPKASAGPPVTGDVPPEVSQAESRGHVFVPLLPRLPWEGDLSMEEASLFSKSNSGDS